MAYTPGPWRVDTAGWDGDGYARYSLSGVTQVCAADARLIAAAPELLEALEALEPHLNAIVCFASSMDEHEPNRLAVNARAAIAKARGEQP